MLIKDIWNFDKKKNPPLFYNKYNSLNEFFDIAKADPQTLKEIQTKELRLMYKTKGAGYEQLNKFLKDILGDKQGTEEDLFAILVNTINEGLDEWRKESRINKNWTEEKRSGLYYHKLDDIISQINTAVDNASNESGGIPAPSLEAIKKAVGYHKKDDFIAAKGKYLEDLAAWILMRAGLVGFSTGAWQAQDKFFNEDSATSIIEDAMGFLVPANGNFSNNSKDNFLGVKIQNYSSMSKSNKQKVNRQLQEWVNSIEGLKGLKVANGEVQIGANISNINDFMNLTRLVENNSAKAKISLSLKFSSGLYEEIQKMSVNIQGKSNIERHLANAGNRSLYYVSGDTYDKWVEFSKTAPVKNHSAVSQQEFNTKYKEFSAYANYNLSKNINRTVYARNEFYITKEGFADLATLMEKRDFCIRIKDTEMSYARFLLNGFKTIYE